MSTLLETETTGDALVARVVGSVQLTARESAALEAAAQSLPERPLVVLDLSQVRHVDGAGVGALVRWHRRLGEQGALLRLAAPTRDVAFMLELLRMHRLFEIYDETGAAVTDPGPEVP